MRVTNQKAGRVFGWLGVSGDVTTDVILRLTQYFYDDIMEADADDETGFVTSWLFRKNFNLITSKIRELIMLFVSSYWGVIKYGDYHYLR
jgi:hypothetical protein